MKQLPLMASEGNWAWELTGKPEFQFILEIVLNFSFEVISQWPLSGKFYLAWKCHFYAKNKYKQLFEIWVNGFHLKWLLRNLFFKNTTIF